VLKLLNEISKKTTLFLKPALLEEIIQKVKDGNVSGVLMKEAYDWIIQAI